MHSFKLNHIDHVAINVKDMKTTIAWYKNVLGLKEHNVKEWEVYPVFMLSGKTGLAIFPANLKDEVCSQNSQNVKISHFAFDVSNNDFEKAKAHLNKLEIDFRLMDHVHFHSLYIRDPDGHKVELTTFIGNEKEFYFL